MTGSKWFTCDRCGFDYPVSYRRKQGGLQVCTYLPCFDKIVQRDNSLGEVADIDDISDLIVEGLDNGF
jgi:hypothetical protein